MAGDSESSSTDHEIVKIGNKIKRLKSKKETLFLRVQTTFDLIKSLNKAGVKESFLIRCTNLSQTVNEFNCAIDEINEYEQLLDPNAVVNYAPLSSMDDLVCKIIDAKAKLSEKVIEVPKTKEGEGSSQATYVFSPKSVLPPLDIKPFSGVNISDWPRFKNLFSSLIKDEKQVSIVQKSYYLHSLLREPASRVVQSYQASSNFDAAWAALCKRYESDRVLANYYIQEILKPTNPPSKPTLENLQHFLSKVGDNIINLKSIGVNDLSEFILFSLAIRQLDNQSRQELELEISDTSFPTCDKLIEFVNKRCRMYELSASDVPQTLKNNSVAIDKPANSKYTRNKVVLSAKAENVKCPVCCSGFHPLYRCSVFLSKTPYERNNQVKELKACFSCLSLSHTLYNCNYKGTCFCKMRHHKLLHYPRKSDSDYNSNVEVKKGAPEEPSVAKVAKIDKASEDKISAECLNLNIKASSNVVGFTVSDNVYNNNIDKSDSLECQEHSTVLLGTALAQMRHNCGKFMTIRLVVDCGSTCSFVTSDLAGRLQLPVQKSEQQFSGLNSAQLGISKGIVSCVLKPKHCNYPQFSVKAFVVDSIVGHLPSVTLPSNVKNMFLQFNLADPKFYESRSVDCLLGSDIFCKILSDNPSKFNTEPAAILSTVLGDIVLGPVPTCNQIKNNCLLSIEKYSNSIDSSVEKLVHKFWECEEVFSHCPPDPQDVYCEQHFIKTHRRDPTGRYIVKLPFKVQSEDLTFPESYSVALQRFLSFERRLVRDEKLKYACFDFMREYLSLQHMELALKEGKYFIPYFCVFNPSSLTTKVRVVFDGSACKNHISLNNVLLSGPKLQKDVCIILTNFRTYRFVLTTDITKMFRQILVNPDDRKYLHILYRENVTEPIREYELKTVTYGLKPSSFLAQRCLVQLANDEGNKFPLAAKAIVEEAFVDDLLSGHETLKGLIQLKDQLCGLFNRAGITLNKWSSNSQEFLSKLRKEAHSQPLLVCDDPNTSVKVLGMLWNPGTDSFSYRININDSNSKCTKRTVLSTIARFYDPLGFAAPITFSLKCFLQEIWKLQNDWDTQLPVNMFNVWKKVVTELPKLETLSIPRCVYNASVSSCQIIGFCDASSLGYCACLYLRVVFDSSEVKCYLLKAKTKVAPLKICSIPRLELLGAVLLSQLYLSLESIINKVGSQSVFLFTDSSIVLAWLRRAPHTLQVFVGNRVVKILELTNITMWYHVSTESNIADIGSRGLSPLELCDRKDWFSGPAWCCEPMTSWPVSQVPPVLEKELPEIKASKSVLLVNEETRLENPLYSIELFSSLSRLLRISAYMLRLVHNVRAAIRGCNSDRISGTITVRERQNALMICLLTVQKVYFSNEICLLKSKKPCSKQFQRLSVFLDSNGLIRVGGRLKNSSLGYEAKHPCLLPKNSKFTNLIINHYHRSYVHAGPRTVRYLIEREFWIINAHSAIRRCIYSCIVCRKFRAQVSAPIMGDLPGPRVRPSPPFSHVFVDFAGPLILKESLRRNSRTYKAYFALFVCLATKACHIEAVTGLSSEEFIATLQRFVSRRGLCSHVYCDQGTNFKGASRHLREIETFLRSNDNKNKIISTLADKNIQFHFSVPHAPFMNGLVESNIKNVKYHFYREIGARVLTLSEFITVLTRVEAVLNSRPLCALSSSPDDYQVLTPGHFLVGGPLLALPELDVSDLAINRLSRWELVNQTSQRLWKRWEREYLHTLQQKNKWFESDENLKVDQLVWIKEDHSSPLSYPLGRINQVNVGPDGIVRSAVVKTKSGQFVRPVRKLAPLLPQSSL